MTIKEIREQFDGVHEYEKDRKEKVRAILDGTSKLNDTELVALMVGMHGMLNTYYHMLDSYFKAHPKEQS